MNELLHRVLLNQKENLQDEVLSQLSELNLLGNSTPEELEMTGEEMATAMKNSAALIDDYNFTMKKMDRWLHFFERGETPDEAAVFGEMPWLQDNYNWLKEKEVIGIAKKNNIAN